MNESLINFLQGYAQSNNWVAILPEILLALLALSLLAVEMVAPKASRSLVSRIAVLGQLAILVMVLFPCACAGGESASYFGGMIEQSGFTQLMRAFFLLCSILVSYLGCLYLGKHSLARTEFYNLVMLVSAAMMLLVQSSHFVMLFVALETVTVAFYVLVAYGRHSSFSLEAGLKYLILGGMSSSILLFGIVLLYGAAGNPELPGSTTDALNFQALLGFIELNSDNLIVRVGAALVVAGMCFKIGAVPFQIWVPDVYQGAPTPVTAYLAVASKAAGFAVLLQLVGGPFLPLSDVLVPLLSLVAAATILFGNVAALTQRNVKRLMGLSGIAHAGYLLVGVVALMMGVEWAKYAVLFYLVTYLFASFAVFAVMSLAVGSEDADQELESYDNFAKKNPFLGGVLATGLGSLAGIPPLGGFIGKLLLFIAAFQAGLHGLLGISILGVVISIYYYFGWVRESFFNNFTDESVGEVKPVTLVDRFVLSSLVMATILIGLVPGVLPILP